MLSIMAVTYVNIRFVVGTLVVPYPIHLVQTDLTKYKFVAITAKQMKW